MLPIESKYRRGMKRQSIEKLSRLNEMPGRKWRQEAGERRRNGNRREVRVGVCDMRGQAGLRERGA